MSTRCSFYYDHDDKNQTHVFEDMAEEHGQIFIEKTQTVESRIALTIQELLSILQSFDLNELRRQANLTDEALRQGAVQYVEKALNSTSFFQHLYFADYPDREKTSKEDQIEYRYQEFVAKRTKLKDLLSEVESKSKVSHKFYFGLEDIK